MQYDINITLNTNSELKNLDFDNVPFGRVFSDHMFVADYENGQWKELRIVPFGEFKIHPACLGLHYGQSIFEGLKASKSKDGEPLLFRPEMHAQRLNRSAARMCMPELPEEIFLQGLEKLVELDHEWIPPAKGSALYIRPLMYANGKFVGVRPSDTYQFIMFTGPVGAYYTEPVKLLVEQKYVRAVVGGPGEAKAAGNYGAAMLPSQLAKNKGYDQLLWLDGKDFKKIQEVGTMNIFFVVDGKVITPELNGAILRGITRDSFITILRDEGIEVEERAIDIDEIVEAHEKGLLQEVFGAGTAAVVAHVADITYGDKVLDLPPMEEREISKSLKMKIDGLRNGTIEDKYGWLRHVDLPVHSNEQSLNGGL